MAHYNLADERGGAEERVARLLWIEALELLEAKKAKRGDERKAA